MKEENNKWLTTFRNQLIAIMFSGMTFALIVNYNFITTINQTIKNENDKSNAKFNNIDKSFEKVNERFDKTEERFDKRFDKIDVRFDRIEDKTDGIYKYNVPDNKQLQEPRKKLPYF